MTVVQLPETHNYWTCLDCGSGSWHIMWPVGKRGEWYVGCTECGSQFNGEKSMSSDKDVTNICEPTPKEEPPVFEVTEKALEDLYDQAYRTGHSNGRHIERLMSGIKKGSN